MYTYELCNISTMQTAEIVQIRNVQYYITMQTVGSVQMRNVQYCSTNCESVQVQNVELRTVHCADGKMQTVQVQTVQMNNMPTKEVYTYRESAKFGCVQVQTLNVQMCELCRLYLCKLCQCASGSSTNSADGIIRST